MTPLLGVAVKVTVLMLLALAVAVGLRRGSAAARHGVLAAAFFGCLLIPALDLLAPSWAVPIPSSWVGLSTESTLRLVGEAPDALEPGAAWPDDASNGLPRTGGSPRATTILMALWMAGAACGIGILAAGLMRLRRIASLGEPVYEGQWRTLADDTARDYRLRRPVRLLLCRHPTMLATWGTVSPAILLPAGSQWWAAPRVRVVLRHELAHIRRGDWLIMLSAHLVTALFWFNPLLWIARRWLRHEGERACDDLVIASGIQAADYATHLLDIARDTARRRHPWSPAIAVAHHSTLEGRVRAMLNDRINRAPLTALARTAIVVLATSATVFIGSATLSSSNASSVRLDIPLAPVDAVRRDTGNPGSRATAVQGQAGGAAQTPGGTIEGVLYDQFGGLLPGASVRLNALETGSVQSAVTDRGGTFTFPGLPPGDYEVVAELAGFVPVRNVILAEAGATVRRHITLPIGTIEETVTVVCSASSSAASRPTAPSASATPGPAAGQAGANRAGVEPTLPSTFTGGIGGQIKAPRKLSHVNPACPSGVALVPTHVQLAGRIGIDGLLTDLQSASDGAAAAYLESAMDATRRWVFTPTLLNGAPIEVNIMISIDYQWAN